MRLVIKAGSVSTKGNPPEVQKMDDGRWAYRVCIWDREKWKSIPVPFCRRQDAEIALAALRERKFQSPAEIRNLGLLKVREIMCSPLQW